MPNNCCKELRLSSDVFSEFSSENSTMIINGAFSMAWLKNFQKSTNPSVFSQDNGSGSKSDALHFCALPSSFKCSEFLCIFLDVPAGRFLLLLRGGDMRHTWSTFPQGSRQTLQDVSVLLGLLVDGSPDARIDHACRPFLAEECHHLLGRSSEEAKAHIRGARLQVQWQYLNYIMAYRPFRRTTRECGRGDTEKSSKGIHIALNWGFLMLDKPLSLVKLQFLQL
ncbi:hypothetical protein RHSIM_Rhsim12G0011100 [Rhododendron simsii]|uniref:Uncharacterized protein n=1 Tax=Rhododendron simsii TaxID=118357 RepID=A0A834G7D0_RHOSS|nr:hypothetical protein RHSIM_Rhsim12G0011100 [Rhododendron simsii]